MTPKDEPLWTALKDELGRWSALGRRPPLWWRDDDATAPCAALERLLCQAEKEDAALVLAVIPGRHQPALAQRLRHHRADFCVWQHGDCHRDLRDPEDKKAVELSATALAAGLDAALVRGRAYLAATYGARFAAILVPPWNRIAEPWFARLPALGYQALSRWGRPRTAFPEINTEIDLLSRGADGSWGFAGGARILRQLTAALARRRRLARADDLCGILTHHLQLDEPSWAFLARLLALIAPALGLPTPQDGRRCAPSASN